MFNNLECKFTIDFAIGEITETLLSRAVKQDGYVHFVKKEKYQTCDEYRIVSKREFPICRNSFFPTIQIKVKELGRASVLCVKYDLHKRTKILLSVITVVSVLLEVLLVFMCLIDRIDFGIVLFAPMLMSFASLASAFLVTRLYVKKINEKLIRSLKKEKETEGGSAS